MLRPRNRVMDPTEMTTSPFVDINQDIRTVMNVVPSHRAGRPAWVNQTLWHGTKWWEYPYALSESGLLNVPPTDRAAVRILDVGSWASIFPCYLTHLGYDVTAIDIQPAPENGLWAGYRATGRLHTILHDITALPILPLRYFQFVTCVCVLEHIRDHVTALRRMRDYLTDDGLLVLTIEFLPPGVYVGSRAVWPTPEMQFNEQTVPRFLAEAGLEPVGAIDYQPPCPWPQHIGEIPSIFPDSGPLSVLGLILQRAD